MRMASIETCRKIDECAISEFKIPSIVLMENAALKVVKNIDLENCHSFCIICAKGNNGGDGFVIARHLYNLDKKVHVFLVGKEEGMSDECSINYNILKNLHISVDNVNSLKDMLSLRESIKESQIVIDGIFGTGLSRNIRGIQDSVISSINENSKYTVSIDVPSGFNGDTGEIMGNCVKADKTVTFQLYKQGFLRYGSDEYTGEVVVENIGIPEMAVQKFIEPRFIMDKSYIKNKLKKRNKLGHKGDYGRVLILGGSQGFTGAAYICAQGAVRSGAGLVTLGCHKDIQPILSSKLVEGMTIQLENDLNLKKAIEKSDAVAIGPGMGTGDSTLNLVDEVLGISRKNVVIDADGINVLKGNLHILKGRKCKVILTPHLGEMSRITGFDIEYIEKNRLKVARDFAAENEVIVLLKGYNTIITDGNAAAVNPMGNSSMASGGMGDCLTGIIASFAAQKYCPFEAACIAAFVHGYSGEKLSRDMFCVNASHILEQLPFSIKELMQ
ncbi:NAD(P)H-hydrate dehydratase [Clostridium luticellarii]|nr:NAD(P)H-hydrate dehydratase [Clostridium luticellarii]MCI1944534.1 NAD(P)H-hydrate dehydratase [Clostridium luticellarii]MCI1968033.1 NAD(P)H-hydrate dehydratase [Clostridium luticellarii]MCI1995575.1 NAD(P)H-hydrate dehydratase [Clostridium luticellarii]MCI2039909.1 NAD(P)H-hydrate dehydratase [Clostridium luticellarii]